MQKLFAFFVAINEYPNPRNCLRGCENDVTHLREFLTAGFSDKYEMVFYPLFNDEATRDAVIAGFEHFNAAQDGDICLFFYSGHGSQVPAPPEFRDIEGDGYLESLVCYDSREPGGRDLIDKELSYLIWKAKGEKDIQFIAFLDCCHSGTGTRDEFDLDVRLKNVLPREDRIKADQFLGRKHYKKDGKGRLMPPRADHILLAAAQANETAKEVSSAGKHRGVFTFCLLDELSKAHRPMSYAEAIHQASMRVRSLVKDQTPRIDTDKPADMQRAFLSEEAAIWQPIFHISFDREKGWIASGGALHGVSRNIKRDQPKFRIVGTDVEFRIKNVHVNWCSIEGSSNMQAKTYYNAELIQEFSPAVFVKFAPDAEAEAVKIISETLEKYKTENFRIGDFEEPDYLLCAEDGKWWISLPFSKYALFEKAGPFDKAAAVELFKKLEHVARWNRLLRLNENATAFRHGIDYQILLERLTESADLSYDAKGEEVDWATTVAMPYDSRRGPSHYPAFRMQIKNTGNRSLWASVVYLESDFGINNILLPCIELEKGKSEWLVLSDGAYRTNAIRVWIKEANLNQGIRKIREYLKLIVSTESFETNAFNQEGLKQEGERDRAFGLGAIRRSSNWQTHTIALSVEAIEE